jgi:hypothetical protein
MAAVRDAAAHPLTPIAMRAGAIALPDEASIA